MNNPFQKASRSQVFLKLGITGPTGSGKTLSALRLAKGLVEPGQRIAFEDTENESASLYADMTEAQCKSLGIPEPIEFDVMPIPPPFLAEHFKSGIDAAVEANYGAVIIDSASHLWRGILKYKGEIDARGGNQWTNWRDPDKKFQEAIDAVLQSKIHVIFCMRSKMEYEQVKDGNKTSINKVGLAPIMKDDLEYEFTSVLDIQMDHKAKASKDRSGLFPDDKIFQITEQTGRDIAAWLKTATPKAETPAPEPKAPTDAEAKAGNIERFRKMLESHRGEHALADFEDLYCQKASATFEDNKTRTSFDEFTLAELRLLWPKRAAVMSIVSAAIPK